MTETIKFVDGVTYSEADQAEWNMRVERPQGIFLDSGLGVLGTTAPGGMLVRVTPGHAMIRGFLYANDANKDVVIAANASGSARIDTVVLRLVPTSNICTALVVQGTPGAGAPSLIQVVGGTWDFPLCDVAVANGAASILAGSLADRRVYSYWPASAIDPTMATDAEVSAAVAAEAALRTTADTTLTTNLNTEISTRQTQFNTQVNANTSLQNQINSLAGQNTNLGTRAAGSIRYDGFVYWSNGLASVTHTGTGTYRVVMSVAIPSARYVILVTPLSVRGLRGTAAILNSTTFDAMIDLYTSGQSAYDNDFNFAVIGG